jgi:hypothetical protein
MARETRASEARPGCALGDGEIGGAYSVGVRGLPQRMPLPKRPPAMAR